MRNIEKLNMPRFAKELTQHFPEQPSHAPRLDVKLNPCHRIVGRNVAAVLAPNVDNGHLCVFAH
jgi:hypothetical protein